MSRIYRSDRKIGNTTCLEDDPYVLELKDHVYCPSGIQNCVPAVFDPGRKMVSQSFYSRGPLPSDVFPSCSMPIDYMEIKAWAPDDTYIFLGEIHDHFGHFLLSTLSRLWRVGELPDTCKIIINAGAALRVEQDHVKALLRAFGVDTSRFWSPEHPVKIRRLLLPCPSFEERNFVHAVFGRAYNAAGDRLVAGTALSIAGNGPIYLSKSRLTAGVRKIMNEHAVEARLAADGYAIVHPETLSIQEQVALWRLGRPIVAFNGSSLHTSALSPRAELVSIGWDAYLDSSFLLCDWANNNRSGYFYLEAGAIQELGPSADHHHGIVGLSSRLELADPRLAAEAILRAVDATFSAPKGDLALGKVTSQSSRYVEADYDASALSATSGRLTGRYQFCTCHETAPWWQVDLGEQCRIDEVVLYNRTDSAPERASGVIILISSDDRSFVPVWQRDDVQPFGGLNGEPCKVGLQACVGRYVRLSILGPDFLHLDKVEVFGSPLCEKGDD